MFTHQIKRNVQVYIDDMLVKSRRKDDHLDDLKETFDTLQFYNMKLNPPSKCAFGVTAGKFMGVSERYRSQPRQDPGHNGDGTTKECERSTKPQRKSSCTE